MLQLPPLSLYVHLPWCVRKCPYCDFNSHESRQPPPFEEYVSALLTDLETELPLVWGRTVHSVFFGGGTPSLFSAQQLERLIEGIRARLPLSPSAEITLEANPGTTEHDSFSAYREAGINRVSLGVQSFNDELLKGIGRIHGQAEVEVAIESLHRARLENFNIDLMFGLPGQTVEQALHDISRAIASGASHISHYQLTLEPNTAFHHNPPALPVDDLCWQMQEEAALLMQQAGFEQYEISAWARDDKACVHNLNYWRFGDFMGIGAGAHGKLSLPAMQAVSKRIRKRHPKAWLEGVALSDGLAMTQDLDEKERLFEFFLNQLRLRRPISRSDFESRTGLDWEIAVPSIRNGVEKGLLDWHPDGVKTTDLGWRFNNEVQALFLP